MTTTAHLERLNAAQRKAATHGEALPEKGYRAGPLLIVAGAGTGKTDTLAHRVAHLVIHGVDPARILMLTFTRRAATEMRRRAHEITRKALNEPMGGVSHGITQRLTWAGTFHSIGNRLLRHYAPHLQLDPHFSVSTAPMPRTSSTACARSSGSRRASNAFRARRRACRSTPTASTPAARSRRRSRSSTPGACSGRRSSHGCSARTSSRNSTRASSTTTTCCSTGTP